MRIFSHYSANNGCLLHRVLLPIRHTADDLPEHEWHLSMGDPAGGYDIYNLYGLWTPKTLQCIAKWKREGSKVVLNLDDLLTEVPESNACKLTEEELSWFCLSLDVADLIVCSTPHLAESLNRPQKTVVARNLLEVSEYGVDRPSPVQGKLRIVWSGSKTHSDDLRLLDGVIDPILTKYGDRVEFIFVGAGGGRDFTKWLNRGVSFEPATNLGMYPRLMGFINPQIVLAPLTDCPFNRSKSSIRCMEAGCLAAPVVASPVGEYSQWVRHGETGYLAETAADWVAALTELIEDQPKRERMGIRGREVVAETGDWSNPDCRSDWKKALTRMTLLK